MRQNNLFWENEIREKLREGKLDISAFQNPDGFKEGRTKVRLNEQYFFILCPNTFALMGKIHHFSVLLPNFTCDATNATVDRRSAASKKHCYIGRPASGRPQRRKNPTA